MSDPTPESTAAWRRRTVYLLVAAVVTLSGYDLAAYRLGGQDATITQVVRDNSAEWLMIPVLAGVLCGHLFWAGGKTNTEGK